MMLLQRRPGAAVLREIVLGSGVFLLWAFPAVSNFVRSADIKSKGPGDLMEFLPLSLN